MYIGSIAGQIMNVFLNVNKSVLKFNICILHLHIQAFYLPYFLWENLFNILTEE